MESSVSHAWYAVTDGSYSRTGKHSSDLSKPSNAAGGVVFFRPDPSCATRLQVLGYTLRFAEQVEKSSHAEIYAAARALKLAALLEMQLRFVGFDNCNEVDRLERFYRSCKRLPPSDPESVRIISFDQIPIDLKKELIRTFEHHSDIHFQKLPKQPAGETKKKKMKKVENLAVKIAHDLAAKNSHEWDDHPPGQFCRAHALSEKHQRRLLEAIQDKEIFPDIPDTITECVPYIHPDPPQILVA